MTYLEILEWQRDQLAASVAAWPSSSASLEAYSEAKARWGRTVWVALKERNRTGRTVWTPWGDLTAGPEESGP